MTTRAGELTRAFDALAAAHGHTGDTALVAGLARRCGWGDRPITAPLLPSGVSHGVPWGLSLAAGSPELRVFVEAQAEPATPASYARMAGEVTAWMAEQGAVLDRWHALVGDAPPHRIWHALMLPLAGPPRWHAYLCLPPAEPRAASEALARIGLRAPALRERDRITIVSLDLVAEAPRIKAYVLMPETVPDELPGGPHAQAFARAMLGDDRPIWWLAAHELTGGTCALHLGIPRHLDEATATARLRGVLATSGLDAAAWERARGPHHFVSFQEQRGAPRVTAYFLPSVQRP